MRFYRGFATVGSMTILSRVLGFARDVLIAAVLGTSAAADAYFVAFRVPSMFRRLFAEGAFDAAFIPLFAKRLHGEGAEAARAFAGQALAGLMVLLVTFTVLAEIAMPWLMLLLAPGFSSDPEKFALAVMLARIALPYLPFMSVVALYTGVLNAYGRFAIAAFTPTLLNVVLIGVLLVFIASGGTQQSTAAIALAWGITASGVLQVLVVAAAAGKLGIGVPWQRARLTPEMRRLAALATPGVIAGGIAQITGVISTIIATLQDRVVSWLYYADRLFQLPLGVIGVAIGVVLLPALSHKLRSGDHAAVLASENRAFEFALLLTMPAAIALYLAAEPIVRVLFQRGAFTAIDTNATASMLAALALGLPAYVLIKVLQPSFFAREDTKTPMIYAGIAMAANVVLSIMLFTIIGATGIAIATALSGLDQRRPAVHHAQAARGLHLRSDLSPPRLGHRRGERLDGRGGVCPGATARSVVRPGERSAGPGSRALRLGRAWPPDLSRRGAPVRRGQFPRFDQGPGHLGIWRTASLRLCCSAANARASIMQGRPRRSVLYMPGSNARALEKAKTIPADAFIFDLEDAVAPDAKLLAREQVCAAVKGGGYGGREIVIRVNALETPWGIDDLLAACQAEPDAILVPKVVHPGDIISTANILQGVHAAEKIRLWAMMETPMAILNARTIAATAVYAENRLCCLVMGTNDLIKESRARALHDRFAVVPWLAMTLVAARAYRLDIIDGVYNDFRDELGLREECERGRTLGMDGKTLIHPDQVWPCNEIFSPTREEVEWSRKVIDAFGQKENEKKGVIVVEGRMVERLHFGMAQRTVAIAEQIREMEAACA